MNVAKALSLLLPLLLAGSAPAGDWPQWRGPNFNGAADEKGLPSTWAKSNAVWVTDLPGPSAATPAIWGDKVFVSSTDPNAGALCALALDRKTGKVLWNKQASEGSLRLDDRSNYATPSPVADGERVFFFYGNGTLVAFDHAGKELWKRDIVKDYGQFAFNWTFSSSPTLYAGKLYLQVLQRNVPARGRGRGNGANNDSYLLAMDPATGKTLWQHVRATDAVGESLEAYSTPIPFVRPERKELLIVGGDHVTAHNLENGEEYWRTGSLNPRHSSNSRQVSSVVTGGGLVLACQPQPGSPVSAIKPEGAGVLPDSAIVWNSSQQRELTSDAPTPLFYDGDFFVLSDSRKLLSRVETATGKMKWSLELPGRQNFHASPTGADGKIYCMNFAAEVVVVDAAKGTVLGTVPMGEAETDLSREYNYGRASIPIAGGQLFIRTAGKLYCVGGT